MKKLLLLLLLSAPGASAQMLKQNGGGGAAFDATANITFSGVDTFANNAVTVSTALAVAGRVLVGTGNSTGGYSFINESGMRMYRQGNNDLRFDIAGATVFQMLGAGVIRINGDDTSGSNTASLQFQSDSNTGIGTDGPDSMHIITGGTQYFKVGKAGDVGFGAILTRSSFTQVGNLIMAPAATVTTSSAVFVGVGISSQAVGGAGAAVTAVCPAGKFAIGGGCTCSGAVAETALTHDFNCIVAGCVPTGYTCQIAGGTGATCSASVMCSRLQ